VARRFDLGDHLACARAVRPLPKVGIKEVEPRRATEKSPNAAIEMHQVSNSPIPRDVSCVTKILEVDKVHVEAAGFVVLDHDVGLLQITRIKAGLVEAPDLRGHRVGDLFAATHVASLDFPGTKHEAAQ